MANKLATVLRELGICDDDSIVPFYPHVRDRDDISVLKCERSGVFLLSSSAHMEITHYKTKQERSFRGGVERRSAIIAGREDAQRRAGQFCDLVSNKKWLDVGTGSGAILDLLARYARATVAVEPQDSARNELTDSGYQMYESVAEVPDADFDVVTLFHVFEHLTEPLDMLTTLRSKMSNEAQIVIEVPHAKDFLIGFLASEAFKAYTFWSEHLILHTRASLERFLAVAGFRNISIIGYQRYPLANHLHWLARGKPGGHIIWSHLRTEGVDHSYGDLMARLDHTDTLIAVATT